MYRRLDVQPRNKERTLIRHSGPQINETRSYVTVIKSIYLWCVDLVSAKGMLLETDDTRVPGIINCLTRAGVIVWLTLSSFLLRFAFLLRFCDSYVTVVIAVALPGNTPVCISLIHLPYETGGYPMLALILWIKVLCYSRILYLEVSIQTSDVC